MRMLVITDRRLPTDHSFIKGVLATELPKLGVDVTFLGFSTQYRGLVEIDRVKYQLFKPWPGGLFVEALQMLLVFPIFMWRAKQFDVIFTRNDPIALILGWLYRLLRNPRARHLHQISFLKAEEILQNRSFSIGHKIAAYGDLVIRRLLLGTVDRVFVVSKNMKRYFCFKYPKLANRIDILPLGVLPQDFTSPMEFSARPIDVVYIGTLARSRRLKVIVDAVQIYNQLYGPLTLKIWGASHDPRDDDDLKAYVRKKGLEKQVEILGKIPRGQLIEKLQKTKIGLSTIPPEGLFLYSSPTKLMEYMAAGCCVIATRGIPEQETIIRESGGGILVDFRPKDIAAAIHELLSNPEKAARMGIQGRAYILEYRNYALMAQKVKEAAEGRQNELSN
ncbi:MAG: glycosyltransferase [Deltaproteobacteria bacterium]|nr:glycosyltransferase [Deltaproteobacteria bacterium]